MMTSRRMGALVLLVMLAVGSARAEETFDLRDTGASEFTLARIISVTGEGEFLFHPPKPGGETVRHPVSVKANYAYLDRRLPGVGRDAAAFRGFRHYVQTKSRIGVGEERGERTLRPERGDIVATLSRKGVEIYSPQGPLNAIEVELLPTPGDPLMLAALLPKEPVQVGQSWVIDDWVASALSSLEVALEQKVSAKLVAVEDSLARVEFESQAKGAVKGTNVEVNVAGELGFDLERKQIISSKVTHKEQREIGSLTPGMTITLTATMRCEPSVDAKAVSDERIRGIATAPATSEQLAIEYDFPWGVRLVADPNWQMFRHSEEMVILRLLEQGSVICQCNIVRAAQVPAGQRTNEKAFQDGIRRSLGDELKEIVSAEEIMGAEDKAIYCVNALGGTDKLVKMWKYYLVTAPDGRQVSFVFMVEPNLTERLGSRDLDLINTLTFTAPPKSPTPAEPAPSAAPAVTSPPPAN